MKFRRNILVTVVAILLTSCSSDFEDENDWICILPPDWGEPVFTFDADSVPHFNALKPMSNADFESKVMGYGWHCNALQMISNNGYISDNILGQYYGLGPTHYYFGTDTMTKFLYVNHLGNVNGGFMYLDQEYIYDEASAHICTIKASNDITDELQLFSYFESPDGKVFLYGICLFGIKSSGVPTYCIATLQRMTGRELADIRKQYSENLADY